MATSFPVDHFSSKEFDYVIVGGGTAGLSLGATLAKGSKSTVAILEAGPNNSNDPLISAISLWGHHFGNARYDWAFHTVPQAFCNDRALYWARGKMLGGSSAINFQAWTCPPKSDLDDWERLGNPGWNWAEHSKQLRRFEGLTMPSDEQVKEQNIWVHPETVGRNGPVKLMYPELRGKPNQIFDEAVRECGIKLAKDPHGGDPHGTSAGLFSWDSRTLTRVYSASAFYHEEKDINFKVLCEAHVSRVITKSKPISKDDELHVASGVEFLHEGKIHTVFAKKEVVLSAGSVQTPQILELTGIGDPRVLGPLGIETKINLPGVGANLQDHMIFPISIELTSDIVWETWDCLFDPELLAMQKKLILGRKGVLSMAGGPVVMATLEDITSPERAKDMYAKLRKRIQDNAQSYSPSVREQHRIMLSSLENNKSAIVEFIGWPGHAFTPGEKGKAYFSINIVLMKTFFRGTIHVNSTDPLAPPTIDPHYLEEEFDLEVAVEAIKYVRKVFQHEKMKNITTKETRPGSGYVTDDELKTYVKDTFMTCFHPVGTASMLPREKDGVVDTRLRVYGTENLRVADCSIVPLHVASHIQALAYGIAGQAADIIKDDSS